MSTSEDKCISCHNVNVIKTNDVTQSYSLCQVCESLQEMISPTPGVMSENQSSDGTRSNECSGVKYEPECSKGSSVEKTQNDQEIQEQFAEVEIDAAQRDVKINFYWNGQPSKDVCMYCGCSTLLQPYEDSVYCKNCFFYQEEPIPAFVPMLVTSSGRIILSDGDSPCEVKMPRSSCKYCRNTVLMKVYNDIVCTLCDYSQITGNLTSIDKKVEQKLSASVKDQTTESLVEE